MTAPLQPVSAAARTMRDSAAVVFGVALLLQLIWFADYRLHSPYYAGLICDSRVYEAWATGILNGDVVGGDVFHQAPLYPYLMAALWAVFGKHYAVIYLAQALLMALTVALVFRIGRALFDERVGWTAALLCAFHGTLNFYAMKVLPDTLGVFLHVWLAWLLLEARTPRQWLAAGAVCGLLILARPHALLLLPMVGAWMVWGRSGRILPPRGERTILLKCAGAFLAPVLALVAVTALRNRALEPGWVLVSANGGENFYMGNNPGAEGSYGRLEGVSPDIEQQKTDVRRAAEAAEGRPLTRSEVSRHWLRRGVAFVRSEPGRYLRLEARKLKRIFSGTEYTNMYFLWFERAEFTPFLHVFGVHFYLILPLTIVGLALTAREWRRLAVLHLMSLLTVLNLLIFYVDERYRLPLFPFLILFGAAGAWRALRIARDSGGSRGHRAALAVLVLAAMGVTAQVYRTEPRRLEVSAQQWYNLAEVHYERRDYRQALSMFHKSSQLAANNWEAAVGVGKTVFALGQRDMGVRLYREAFPHLDPVIQDDLRRDRDLDALRSYGGIDL